SVEDLLREEVDIAVRITSEPPGHLVARELGRVRYVVCASPAYAARRGLPQRPEALCGAPVISAAVIGRPLRLSAYQGSQRQQVTLDPTIASRNYPLLRDAALAGLGVAVVPDYVVYEDVAQGRMLTALDDWRLSIFGRSMYLLYMPSRHHPRAISMLIEFIVDKAHAAHEWRPGLLPLR